MEQTILNPSKTINCKKTVVILLVISLVFSAISSINSFGYYFYSGSNTFTLAYGDILDGLLSLILSIAPEILLLAYIFKYNDAKGSRLVFFALLVIAISNLYSAVPILIIWDQISHSPESLTLHLKYIILYIVYLITYSLAAISARKGLKNKIFIIVPTGISLIFSAISLFSLPGNINYYLETEQYLYIITSLAGTISAITLNIALLLFGLKNTITPITKKQKTKPTNGEGANPTLDPEQALILLKSKLDNGLITEEEYQLQRAEIIKKL